MEATTQHAKEKSNSFKTKSEVLETKIDQELEKASKKRDEASKKRNEALKSRDKAFQLLKLVSDKNKNVEKLKAIALKSKKEDARNLDLFAQDIEEETLVLIDEASILEKNAQNLDKDAQDLEIEAQNIESKALNDDEVLLKRYREALKRDIDSQKRDKASQVRNENTLELIKILNSREKEIIHLKNYRNTINKKRKWRIVFAIMMIIVFIVDIGVILCNISCLTMDKSTFVINNINFNIGVLGLKNGIFAIILLWIIVLFVIYGFYSSIKSYHRYNNAIHKLDILIMRLELYTDKDLVTPYRLGRELEMIYRILES